MFHCPVFKSGIGQWLLRKEGNLMITDYVCNKLVASVSKESPAH